MEKIDILALTKKFTEGKCTEQELAMLESWYLEWEPGDTDADAKQIIQAGDAVWKRLPVYKQKNERSRSGTGIIRKGFFVWAAAAACLVGVLGVLIFYNTGSKDRGELISSTNDVPPGANKVILTLSSGKKILINDSTQNEIVGQQGSSIKSQDGKLIYSADGAQVVENIYNTLETPSGGQYSVVLPDGSQVWLNAQSKLFYPVRFTGKYRKVELQGEAYFEISHDKAHPFKVVSGEQELEVLGTHFNISNYQDDPAQKTTLLEGSVRLSAGQKGSAQILKPGEQAVVKESSMTIKSVNTDEAVAWKEGDFMFENQSLPEIMRKVARWYNVKINYQDGIDLKGTFSGTISRSRNISSVLKMLQQTADLQFRMKGKDITVSSPEKNK